jgi:hypothetical protein
MSNRSFALIKVTVAGGVATCDPDWVRLFWEDGPTDIRWEFHGVPSEVTEAVVEFHDVEPPKHAGTHAHRGGFRPRGVHRGGGHAGTAGGSHLPDIVSSGNTMQEGYFTYDLKLFDKSGKLVAEADPGGDNQPTGP